MSWYEDMIGGIADNYSGGDGLAGLGGDGGGSWWNTLFSGDGGGSSGGWGSLISGVMGAFGGDDSGGGGNTSNLWGDLMKGVLGGVGASAGAKSDLENARKLAETKGIEDRKTMSFEGQLLDYYKQKEKNEKRVALDTYGQFSRLHSWAPNAVNPAVPAVPTRPTP